MKASDLPVVSIVVCSYNGGQSIGRTIESLLRQSYPADKREIIVVNDGSVDDTDAVAGGYPVRVVTHLSNEGLAAARNTGYQHASGEILCFTDDDCVAQSDWVQELVAAYRRHPGAAGVGGRVEPGSLTNAFEKWYTFSGSRVGTHSAEQKGSGILYSMLKILGVGKPDSLEDGSPLSGLMGANSSFRREIVTQVGGWDPRFHICGDDVDFSYRVRKQGHRLVYAPKAVVRHYYRATLRSFVKHNTNYGRGYAVFMKRHGLNLWLFMARLVWQPALVLGLGAISAAVGHMAPFALGLVFMVARALPQTLPVAARQKDYSLLLMLPLLDLARPLFFLYGMLDELYGTA